jgi:DNA polymerase-4
LDRGARIVCVDLDTFFVSIERLLDPSLEGRPVVVGGVGHRGVVTSASYEVRPLGVHSGMPLAQARKLAPHALFLPNRHEVYGEHAERVRELLLTVTDQVQQASIDEFYLDLHGCERLWARPGDEDADATVERVIRELRERIGREVGLPASAGIGVSRPIAKIASRFAKPAGVFRVRAGTERAFLAPLPVRRWPGIGPVTGERLQQAGIETLGQLLELLDQPGPQRARFEEVAQTVLRGMGLQGLGRDRPLFQEHDQQDLTEGSLSNERTFEQDMSDRQQVHDHLRSLVERVCWRARERGVVARTVTLKLRTRDFRTLTRSRTGTATASDGRVLEVVRSLLQEGWTGQQPLRLCGVALSNLEPTSPQLGLPFGAPAARQAPELPLREAVPPREAAASPPVWAQQPPLRERPDVQEALDRVRERFGYDAIHLGSVRK